MVASVSAERSLQWEDNDDDDAGNELRVGPNLTWDKFKWLPFIKTVWREKSSSNSASVDCTRRRTKALCVSPNHI